MVLERLALQNFRNYKKVLFGFSPQTSLLVGPNTSGKTNVLEAIFLLSLGRTFRPGLEREMIRFGEEVGRVKGTVGGMELEVVLTRGEVLGKPAPLKKLLVNGVSKRLFNFVGNLQVVMFGPEDLELVTNSPSLRRAHLDFILEQVDREYRRCSQIYSRVLVQRNKLLKMIREGRRSRRELEYWDKLLVENGGCITKKRQEFFDFVNKLPKKLGELEFVYQPSVLSAHDASVDSSKVLAVETKSCSHLAISYSTCSHLYKERLSKERDREIAAGMTLVGPHRDDFAFEIQNPKSKIQNRNLTIFGSRGEQRTAVLALKLAELEFMTEVLGERPVLLLDDIFSELDKDNRREILRVIPKQQTIITTTDLGVVEKEFLDKIKIIDLGAQIR